VRQGFATWSNASVTFSGSAIIRSTAIATNSAAELGAGGANGPAS
jgi:hypothetical protein